MAALPASQPISDLVIAALALALSLSNALKGIGSVTLRCPAAGAASIGDPAHWSQLCTGKGRGECEDLSREGSTGTQAPDARLQQGRAAQGCWRHSLLSKAAPLLRQLPSLPALGSKSAKVFLSHRRMPTVPTAHSLPHRCAHRSQAHGPPPLVPPTSTPRARTSLVLTRRKSCRPWGGPQTRTAPPPPQLP